MEHSKTGQQNSKTFQRILFKQHTVIIITMRNIQFNQIQT